MLKHHLVPIIILYSLFLLIAQVSQRSSEIDNFSIICIARYEWIKIRSWRKSCYQNKSQFHARDTKPQLPVQIAFEQIHCRLIIVQMFLYYYEILWDKFYPRGSRIFSRGIRKNSLKKFTRNFIPRFKKNTAPHTKQWCYQLYAVQVNKSRDNHQSLCAPMPYVKCFKNEKIDLNLLLNANDVTLTIIRHQLFYECSHRYTSTKTRGVIVHQLKLSDG